MPPRKKRKARNRKQGGTPAPERPASTQSSRLATIFRGGALLVCSAALALGPFAPSASFNFRLRIVIAALFMVSGSLWALSLAVEGGAALLSTGMGAPSVLFLAAVAAATVMARSKRPALVEAFAWFSFAAAFLTVLQSTLRRQLRQIFLAFLLASAAVVSVHAMHQAVVSLPETREVFQRDRERALRMVGLPPEAAFDFEGRLGTSRVMGTFLLPNTLAGFLVLMIPIAIGLLAEQWRERRLELGKDHFAFNGLACAVMLLCLYQTGSKGGWLAFGFAAAAFYAGASDWFKRKFGRKLLAAVACAAVVVLVAQHARLLPPLGDYWGSLVARTAYWRGAADAAAERPMFGVGPGNFADAYMANKRAGDEETRYAHNDYLQLAAELGVFGLLGYLALWWRFWKKTGLFPKGGGGEGPDAQPAGGNEEEPDPIGGTPPRWWAGWTAAAGVAAFAIVMLFGLMPGSSRGAWVWAWPAGLGLLWTGLALANARPEAWVSFKRGGMAHAGIRAGLVGFLAHGLLDFDLHVQGIAQTVAALAALALASCPRKFAFQGRLSPTARLGLAAVPLGLTLWVWAGWASPLLHASVLFEQASSAEADMAPARRIALLEQTVSLDPLHDDAYALLARMRLRYERNLPKALEAAREAARLSPARSSHRSLLADIYLESYRNAPLPRTLRQAYAEKKAAVRLFPSYPLLRIELAEIAAMDGRHSEELALLQEALRLDKEQYHIRRRLSKGQRARAEARIRELGGEI